MVEAGSFLEAWLREASEKNDRASELAALSELTGYYRSVGRAVESIETGERAMDLLSALGVDRGTQRAAALVNLATAHRAARNTAKAISLYAQAEMSLAAGGGGSYEASALYNNLGGALAAAGEPERALACFTQALSILEGLEDTGSERATALAGIGAMQLSLSRIDEARTSLEKSLELFEHLPGEDPHVPSALAALGRLRYMEGETEEALSLFARAAEKTAAFFGANQDYAGLCRSCAALCERLDRPEEAKQWRDRGEARYERSGAVPAVL
ncbi:MAG: tetratricopeptide repeat protein [Oscillospiraceae bacterium]|nr:tetratricopeptide repeat protein [Oscillospiraceae bacterium]